MHTDLWLDLRQSLRLLAKDRAFTFSAVLTLALGLGANIAIFSVLNAALLRPLPFPEPERLLYISNADAKTGDPYPVDAADFYEFRTGVTSFEDVGMVRYREAMSLAAGSGEPEAVMAHLATSGLLRALGVTPLYGLFFTPEEERFGSDQAVLLGYAIWQRSFGGRPDVVGTRVLVGGRPSVVTGVLPKSFESPGRPADVWAPLAPSPPEIERRFQHRYYMVARLKPGATIERARAELEAINQRMAKEHPRTNTFAIRAVRLIDERAASSRASLWMLMAAVGLVLLIACANVASLLLARATARQKEIAVRMALGAGRGRILRQVLTESLLLALAGGLAGIGVAYAAIRSLGSLLPANLPGRDSIALDPVTLGFAVLVSVVTGVVFGASPALHTARAEAVDALRQRFNAGSRRSLRLRSLLVVGEVAVSTVLLVGSGLLVRSFLRVMATDPGLDTHNVLSMLIMLPRARYATAEPVNRFYDELLRKTEVLPGVESVGIVNRLPLNGSLGSGPMSIEGRPTPNSDTPTVDWRSVNPDYFRTMGIARVAGRGIEETDKLDAPHVVVIDDKIAARYWPHENPIGRRVKLGDYVENSPWMEIVGVVHTVRHDGLEKESFGQVYRPYWQWAIHGINIQNYALAIRTRGPAEAMAQTARRTILEVDPNQTATEVQTMQAILDRSVAPRRFLTLLVGAFASLALLLASFGLYAVIAYSVLLRRPEIGIRMALGASGGDVVALVAGQTGRLVAWGLAIGLAGAVLLSRWVESLLFGVSRFDWLVFAAAAGMIAMVAVLAAFAPARRALRIDPARALGSAS